MTDLLVELLALALYGPLLVLLHEGGHALFARPGGYRVTSFAIGLGAPLWSVYLRRGVVVHVDRWILAGGACTAIPDGPPTSRRAWFHAGGLVVQGLLAMVLVALPDVWLVDRLERFNALVAATNLLPWRIGGQASDGWYLMDLATGGRRTVGVLGQRRQLEQMARREAAVGSPVGRVYSEVCVAWSQLLVGRPEAAAALFRADPPETTVVPWVDALYLYVRAEWHRLEGRALAALRAARDGLRDLDRPTDEAASLLAVAEARALVDLGAPEQAQRALARAIGVGGPIGLQAAAVLLHASVDGPADELELAAWRLLRRPLDAALDPIDVALALSRAADRLEAADRPQAAFGVRLAGADLMRRAVDGLEPNDRDAVHERLAIAGAPWDASSSSRASTAPGPPPRPSGS